MKISVIIPVFNRIDSLKSAVESVLCQTFKPIELIVVDDGSSLDIRGALTPYLSSIKLLHLKENRGVSAARNAGIKAATGNFIALLDSDDLWLPFKLELQIKRMLDSNAMISHTDEFWWKSGKFVNQGKNHTKYGGDIFCKILDICRISPSSAVFHRSVFEKIGFFEESLKACEDYDMWLRIAAVYSILYIPIKSIVKRAFLEDHLSANVGHLEYLRLLSLCQFISVKKELNYFNVKSAYKEIARKFDIVCSGLNKANFIIY